MISIFPVVKKIDSGKPVSFCESAYAAAQGADMVCVMTPWDEFKTLDWQKIMSCMRGRVIVDPYRVIPSDQASGFLHLVLGKDAGIGDLLTATVPA